MQISWTANPEARNLQHRGAENILKNAPGPRGAVMYVKTLIEAFALFFTDDMINSIT